VDELAGDELTVNACGYLGVIGPAVLLRVMSHIMLAFCTGRLEHGGLAHILTYSVSYRVRTAIRGMVLG